MNGPGLHGNVLITGGAGTLGHAIVRLAQAESWPVRFTIFSRSEHRQAEMRAKYPEARYVIGDVRDYAAVRAAVSDHDLIIHAAALKRVPECETSPLECAKTNVDGSANVFRAGIDAGIARIVAISTDKACGAITAYGASKRLMEAMIQTMSTPLTRITGARYGNVAGSNGSVVPLWKDLARRSMPIQLTDATCTRFWMSEDEAVAAIALAATLQAGEILIPRAHSLEMRSLAQYVAPGLPVLVTGLRSREKLHEELVHRDEAVIECFPGYYVLLKDGTPSGVSYTSQHAARLTSYHMQQLFGEQGVEVVSDTL